MLALIEDNISLNLLYSFLLLAISVSIPLCLWLFFRKSRNLNDLMLDSIRRADDSEKSIQDLLERISDIEAKFPELSSAFETSDQPSAHSSNGSDSEIHPFESPFGEQDRDLKNNQEKLRWSEEQELKASFDIVRACHRYRHLFGEKIREFESVASKPVSFGILKSLSALYRLNGERESSYNLHNIAAPYHRALAKQLHLKKGPQFDQFIIELLTLIDAQVVSLNLLISIYDQSILVDIKNRFARNKQGEIVVKRKYR